MVFKLYLLAAGFYVVHILRVDYELPGMIMEYSCILHSLRPKAVL